MTRYLVLFALGALPPAHVFAAESDIIISRVLTNPPGVDTGLEYIEIKNSGSSDEELSGWTLYPDGVGYFVFPTFTLGADARVKIHLRTSGVDSETDLYHATASMNMGNTSGSVALFSGAEKNKNTIVDFMQYGKGGETWEGTAADATLWERGTFVPVDSAVEGKEMQRINEAHGVAYWGTGDALGEIVPEGEEQEAEIDFGGNVYSGPTIAPSIRAYAGPDQKGIAGAQIIVSGKGIGWEDEELTGEHVRYVWNFGDGVLREGKELRHTYMYPGTYIATLIVSSGEDTAQDTLTIRVTHNPVYISEVVPGPTGWVEIANPSGDIVDVGEWSLAVGENSRFQFPRGTYIMAKAFTVFSAEATGITLDVSRDSLTLSYPNGNRASAFSYSVTPSVRTGEALVIESGMVLRAPPSPGSQTLPVREETPAKLTATRTISETPVASIPPPEPKEDQIEKIIHERAQEASVANISSDDIRKGVNVNIFWLFGSIVGGLIVGFLASYIRRFYAPVSS